MLALPNPSNITRISESISKMEGWCLSTLGSRHVMKQSQNMMVEHLSNVHKDCAEVGRYNHESAYSYQARTDQRRTAASHAVLKREDPCAPLEAWTPNSDESWQSMF